MGSAASTGEWEPFRQAADELGLTVVWVVERERIDPYYAGRSGSGGAMARAPAELHPDYRRAVLLGSGGGRFWSNFRAARSAPPRPEENPLDRYTERVVEPLIEGLRAADPAAVAAYPFTHDRQLLPFLGLIESVPALQTRPFGIPIDGSHGPWFAWRAAILTATPYPPTEWLPEAPCAACDAPCVRICPVQAVDVAGFRWGDCVAYRQSDGSCGERCLAREACPVGTASRYPREAIRYHYGASLRTIRARASGAAPGGPR